MLSSANLAQLVENSAASRVLSGGLLPTNNNPSFTSLNSVTTVSIIENNGKTPVAFGAFNQYSSKQTYCMVGKVADKFKNTTVWIEQETDDKESNHTVFKVTSSEQGKTNHLGHGTYNAVFGDHEGRLVEEHLMDALVNSSIGNKMLDSTKNVTIDIVGEEDYAGWRDDAGFVVSDRSRFVEVTCARSSLKNLGGVAAQTVEVLGKHNISAVFDYDGEVTTMDRQEFLVALSTIDGISGAVAFDSNKQVIGFVITLGSRILCCYAEEPNVASQMIGFATEQMPDEDITFFALADAAPFVEELIGNSKSRVTITRLHTRSNIKQVKWEKVYFPNIGLNLF